MTFLLPNDVTNNTTSVIVLKDHIFQIWPFFDIDNKLY